MQPFPKYEEVIKLIKENENEVQKDILSSSFQNSLTCLKFKTSQIEQLRNSILLVDDVYSIQILFRSLIEHFFISFYVFLKCRIEGNDSVGEEYYDFYANSEFFKQEYYSIGVDNLGKGKNMKADIEALKAQYPSLSNISQKELDGYHTEGSNFQTSERLLSF